jgi:hypothetical protein
MATVQLDLFLPMCARWASRQGRLFDPDDVRAGDSGRTCGACGAHLVRTDGYLTCPRGHGRLIEIEGTGHEG